MVSAWGFTEDSFRVPSQAELDRLLPLVDSSQVSVTPSLDSNGDGPKATVTLGPGQAIDLGGLAKGYAADKIVGVLREHDVPRANINLGGNVLAYGGRPDGTPWRVAIQDPARVGEQDAFAGVLALTDSFAVTSGGYQRYFEQDGVTYWHILDPDTAAPARSGLSSVTVVAPSALTCDGLSTALFVMGLEEGTQFWRDHPELEFEAIFVTESGEIFRTAGLEGRFSLAEGYQDREVVVLE